MGNPSGPASGVGDTLPLSGGLAGGTVLG